MEATKNKPKCASQCSEHVFQLVNHNGNNKHNVRVAFCPKFRRDPYPPEKTIPEYNLDNRYYTQAFVLGTERKALTNNHHQDLMNFQTMTKDACQKNNQIFFPKPNEKNSYCSVCKEHFQNYYQHIREQDHRTKIDAAIYNTEIKRLSDFYKDLWPNSHLKADQIVRELMKQSEMIKNGIKNENDEQVSEQEGSENEELEDEQDQENQSEDGNDAEEDQQQEQYELESEQVRGRKKKVLHEEHKAEVHQGQKKKRSQPVQNRQNYTQKVIKQAKEHSEQLTQKFKISQVFFDHKPADFVVFLKKNKQGKYKMVRDLDPMLKNGEFSEMDEEVNEEPREDQRKSQRLPTKTYKDEKAKEYYKVKKQQPEVEDDENQKDSSDFSLEEGRNGYSSKNHNNNVDRIRTRKQQKQDKKQSSTNAQKQYQPHTQKQAPKEPDTNNSRGYPPYQMTPQMYQQYNVQRMQAHMNKNMQNPQTMQKMPMMQGHMDPQLQQIPRMPMQGMQYPPMNFQPGQQPKGPINHPYARFYPPNINMMGYNVPINGVPVTKPDEKKQKGPQQQQQQQPFSQPQQMYYPQWGNYMMPQQIMRPDGADQRGQMVPPMNYQMMQNPNKPPQPGMQPQGQKMGMYMPYQMDPRYGNPYGYAQHMAPSSQQFLQKKPEPNKQPK